MGKLDKVFLNILDEFASMSHCVSKKVAAMAVKDGRIIATGINGTAPGYLNCDSIFDETSFDRDIHHKFSTTYEIHAEMNMILFAAKNGISLDGATLYCSMAPCWNCIKHISVVGIKKIIYNRPYDLLSEEEGKAIQHYCDTLGIDLVRYEVE